MSSILIHMQSVVQTLQLKCPIFFSGVGEEKNRRNKKRKHNVIYQNEVRQLTHSKWMSIVSVEEANKYVWYWCHSRSTLLPENIWILCKCKCVYTPKQQHYTVTGARTNSQVWPRPSLDVKQGESGSYNHKSWVLLHTASLTGGGG